MYKTNTIQCLGKSNKELFFPLKTTGQHSFMNQKKEKKRKMKGITNVLNWILWRDPVSFSSLFPSCPALVGDRTCPLWFGAFFWDVPSSYCCFLSLFSSSSFFYSAVLRDSFSSRKEHTQCEREKVNLSSKTSSGNINHVINEKKCTSFNLFIYTFYTTVVITLGVFLVVSFFCLSERLKWKCTEHV